MGPMVSFAQTQTIIVILIVLGLIIFMVRKPKLFFSVVRLRLLPAGLFYLILIISGSGSGQKKKMIHEEESSSTLNADRPPGWFSYHYPECWPNAFICTPGSFLA
jgi:hypothetical protein